MTERPLVEITVAAPPDEVWRALREPQRILQWFGWDADSLADEVKYIFHDHAHADEAARRLQFEPWEGKADAFELAPHGDGTLLRVVRTGAGAGTDWDSTFDDLREGWTSFVHQLKLALEQHPGEARRTLYLSGRPKGPPAREALGLDGLPASGPYRLPAAPGGPLAGEVRRRGAFQAIATVEPWGDGLLAVIDKPGGGSQATLTTYGLSDADFETLSRAWRGWWDQRFEAPSA